MKLSIIIPVFNVEKYIEKCLLSCINQDISRNEYEIIIVNDGSPDNSLEIAERIANGYSNIRIISQENQGLSAARNTGLKSAQGEYVWFIDSDDYIEEDCLGRIVSALTNNLDIFQLQYRLVYENDTPSIVPKYCIVKGVKTGLEITALGGLPAPAQFSIFRTKFLKENNLEFLKGVYHEDSEFKPRAVYLAQKIASDTKFCYNYLQRISGSITSNFKLKNGLDILKVNLSLLNFVKQQKMRLRYKKCIYRIIGKNMNTLLYGIHKLNEQDKNKLIYELGLRKEMFKLMMNSGQLIYMLEGLIFTLNIRVGLFLHYYVR